MQSEHINELMAALSKAQGEFKFAVKDAKNPYFKSNYADLASVNEACQGALTKHGLAVVQATNVYESGFITLVTTLGHASGQWIKSIYPINPIKNDPQGVGSAVTYARRYSLSAILGVIASDDDGEAAHGRVDNRKVEAKVEEKKVEPIDENHLYREGDAQIKQISQWMKQNKLLMDSEQIVRKNIVQNALDSKQKMSELKETILSYGAKSE